MENIQTYLEGKYFSTPNKYTSFSYIFIKFKNSSNPSRQNIIFTALEKESHNR
jgi:hypothetical protein